MGEGHGKDNMYVVANGEEGLEWTKRANCIWGGGGGEGIDVEGELRLEFIHLLTHYQTLQTKSRAKCLQNPRKFIIS